MDFFSQLERPRHLKLSEVRSQKAKRRAIEKQGLTEKKKEKVEFKICHGELALQIFLALCESGGLCPKCRINQQSNEPYKVYNPNSNQTNT